MSTKPKPRHHYNDPGSNNQLGTEQDWQLQMSKWIMATNKSFRRKVPLELLISLGVTYQELISTGYSRCEVQRRMMLSIGNTIDMVDLETNPAFDNAASKKYESALRYNATYHPPGTLFHATDQQEDNPKKKRRITDENKAPVPLLQSKQRFFPSNNKRESISVLYVLSKDAALASMNSDDELINLVETRLDTDPDLNKDALHNLDLFNSININLKNSDIATLPVTPSSMEQIGIQLGIMLEFEHGLSSKFGTDVKVRFAKEDTFLECINNSPSKTANFIAEHFNCFVYPDLKHLCHTQSSSSITQGELFLSFLTSELMMKYQMKIHPAPSLVYDSLNNHFQCTVFSEIGRPFLSLDLSRFPDFRTLAHQVKNNLVLKYKNTNRHEIKHLVTTEHLNEHGIVGMPCIGNNRMYIRVRYKRNGEICVTFLSNGNLLHDLQSYKNTMATTGQYTFAPYIPNMDEHNSTFMFLIQKKSQLSRMYTVHHGPDNMQPVVKDWNRNQGGFADRKFQEKVKHQILCLMRTKLNWEHLAQKTCIGVKTIPIADSYIVKHARIIHPNTTFLTKNQAGDVDGERNTLSLKTYWEYHADIITQYLDGKWRQWYSI